MKNRVVKLIMAVTLIVAVTSCATSSIYEEGGIGGTGFTEQQF